VVEQLQGAPLAASTLETDLLPSRMQYRVGDLDTLIAAGEVVWVGLEPVGERDGRIALYLADQLPLLARPPAPRGEPDELRERVRAVLAERGAQFFVSLMTAVETGWTQEVLDALWDLVWAGEVTNDSLAPLRAYVQGPSSGRSERQQLRRQRLPTAPFRSRRAAPPTGAGRWSLVRQGQVGQPTATERAHALALQLLERHGVLTREQVLAEGVPGGFSTLYPILTSLEEAGRIRRGYFVAGLGASQFAVPAAVERLRQLREPPEHPLAVTLAATDPANLYGNTLRWPEREDGARVSRSVGALVIQVDGEPAAYLGRGERSLLTWPAADPVRQDAVEQAVAAALADLVHRGRLIGLQLATVDGQPATDSALGPALEQAGFRRTSFGYMLRPGEANPPRVHRQEEPVRWARSP
jgi:ATP-dependent Lhr-like helicase